MVSSLGDGSLLRDPTDYLQPIVFDTTTRLAQRGQG